VERRKARSGILGASYWPSMPVGEHAVTGGSRDHIKARGQRSDRHRWLRSHQRRRSEDRNEARGRDRINAGRVPGEVSAARWAQRRRSRGERRDHIKAVRAEPELVNWDAEQTEQVKAWLPEEPGPGSRG
jgi:hypothetical protein